MRANAKPTRTAIYPWASKDDGSHDPENQLMQLREFPRREGYDLLGEYVDRESGRKGRRERTDFPLLFDDAARRRFDLVLF